MGLSPPVRAGSSSMKDPGKQSPQVVGGDVVAYDGCFSCSAKKPLQTVSKVGAEPHGFRTHRFGTREHFCEAWDLKLQIQ